MIIREEELPLDCKHCVYREGMWCFGHSSNLQVTALSYKTEYCVSIPDYE